MYYRPTVLKNRRLQTASLDRIDSSKGYIEGNVQWLHKDINRLKINYSDEDLIQICLEIIRWKKVPINV